MTKKSSGAPFTLTGSLLPSSTPSVTNSPLFAGKATAGKASTWGYHELLDMIEGVFDRLDAEFRVVINKMPEVKRKPVSCDACSSKDPGCCYQKVMISLMEAMVIARFLDRAGRNTPEFRAELHAAGDLMEGLTRDDFFLEHRKCVFLEDGRCSVYPVRPGVCRSYFVLTPSEDCSGPLHTEILSVDNQSYLKQSLRLAVDTHRSLGLRENEMRILSGALPRMVVLSLEMLESDDYPEFIRSQKWPTSETLEEWVAEGKNVFGERLYQIGRRKTRP